jgi:Na+-driven multidrug efflux pump
MKQNTKLPLLEMPIGKALLVLSIPIVITNMLQVAYHFTDAYWV